MAPSVLSCGLTDRDCPHNRSGSDPTAHPGRYEGSEGQGRLRGKQPKLKPNQPSTCSSYTTQGATPKVSLPNSSASGDPPSCGTHASRPAYGCAVQPEQPPRNAQPPDVLIVCPHHPNSSLCIRLSPL